MKQDRTFITLPPIQNYPWYVRIAFNAQKRKYGDVLYPTMHWGMIPTLFLLFSGFFKYLERKSSTLEPTIRSLVMVRVSQINWCKFCVDLNSLMLIQRSGSEEKLNELHDWKNSRKLNKKEKTALAYAEAVTQSVREVQNSDRDPLKEFFNDREIVELTALIAYQNMSSKFNSALNIPSQGLCDISKKP